MLFLSIINHEIADKRNDYVKKKVISNLYNLIIYFQSICTKVIGENYSEFGMIGTKHNLIGDLKEGSISIKEEKELDKIEILVNYFFRKLYADIKRVYYRSDVLWR